jgi:hypothetical protein
LKGNCKFGPKCANIHVLPNGLRVNYKQGGPGHLNIGGRLNTDLYHPQNSGSALTNSFNHANATPASPYSQQYSPFTSQDEAYPPLGGRHQSIDITVPANVPTIDTSFASHPGSAYGSPRDEDMSRFGAGSAFSPVAGKGLSVLDAPLPASFDSNGVSWIARHGPMASPVPSKFGLESPPGSVGAAKDNRTSEALKSLHSSAFGEDTRDRFNGTSPPAQPAEEYFGKRVMHSQRFATKSKNISASLPKAVDQDWDNSFGFEEDLLPEALKDLMTPQEKARRGSRTYADEDGRPFNSGTGTPNDTPTKFGSPSNASPSSRWNTLPLWQKQEDEKERAATSRAAYLGHVGSPLRNSSLHPGASPSSRPIARPSNSGDSSPYLASPPRKSSMSIISQQLQRTRLSRAESNGSDSGLHPSRATSNPIGSGSGRAGLIGERQVSSSSIGNGGSGRFTTPIGEEQGDFVFNMEGMEEVDEKKGEKRNSGGWIYAGGTSSPHLGAIGGTPQNGATNGSSVGGVEGMFGARRAF